MAATDFSAHSVSVLTHGAAIARRYRSKFYVAHVIPTDVYKSVPTEVMDEALKQTRAYVQDAMANQLRFEFLQAVQNEPVIKEGQVAPELLYKLPNGDSPHREHGRIALSRIRPVGPLPPVRIRGSGQSSRWPECRREPPEAKRSAKLPDCHRVI